MNRLIKCSFFVMLYLFANNILFAQSEPVPYWYSDRNTLKEGNNFVYLVGMGQGNTINSARKEALDEAVKDAIAYLRSLNVPETEIDSRLKIKMNDDTNEGWKTICLKTYKIKNDDNMYKVFILYRFKKNIYREFGDNDEFIDCDATFDKKVERYYEQFGSGRRYITQQSSRTECYPGEQVMENPSVSERKTESTDEKTWQYYEKNDLIVALTNTSINDGYGQWHRADIIISNNSTCPIEFVPEDDITAYSINKKNERKESEVWSNERYNKKVESAQNLVNIANGLNKLAGTLSNGRSSGGPYYNYTLPTRNTSIDLSKDQINVYNLSFLKNQRGYSNVKNMGYLTRHTIQPNQTIMGYVYIKREKGESIYITIKTKINGAENINAKYVYGWNY